MPIEWERKLRTLFVRKKLTNDQKWIETSFIKIFRKILTDEETKWNSFFLSDESNLLISISFDKRQRSWKSAKRLAQVSSSSQRTSSIACHCLCDSSWSYSYYSFSVDLLSIEMVSHCWIFSLLIEYIQGKASEKERHLRFIMYSFIIEGNRRINRVRTRYGFEPLEESSLVLVNLSMTYPIVKVLLPLRIGLSLFSRHG